MELISTPSLVTAVASIVVYACVYRWILQRNIRGPKAWPVIGHALEVVAHRRLIYDGLTDYCRNYFPTFQFRIPGRTFVVTVDPVNVEYIYKTNFNNYWKGETEGTPSFDVLGYGFFNTHGDDWRKHRKVASHEFTSRKLRNYSTQNFKAFGLRLCDILQEAVNNNEPVSIRDLACRTSFESICKIGFGNDIGLLNRNLPKAPFVEDFDAASKLSVRRFIDPFWKITRFLSIGPEARLKKHIKNLRTFTRELVQTRIAEIAAHKQDKPDLLSRYAEAMKKESFTSNPMKDLQDTVLNYLFAARDTTAAAFAWTIYAISREPRVEQKIVEELMRLEAEGRRETKTHEGEDDENDGADYPDGEFGDFVRLLDHNTVTTKLNYLQATLFESMRLYPPAPINYRVPIKDDVLPTCGTKVKAGDHVIIASYAQARMPQLWGDDCLELKPERWLTDGVFKQESPFKFTIFHGGPRLCMGKESATLLLLITLAMIYRFFTFELAPGEKVEYIFGITLDIKENGLKMVPRKRS
ncbi:hypothetical protein R1sor_026431 [Riccia sorocarpa]|uniref:Cytochrome P450 n=1 Tax=Riccia sorocarpa TaxID=122646 RepID=A0ABD3GBC4_9MARC